jgi:transcriptional regulator with XRE-family HTH domain
MFLELSYSFKIGKVNSLFGESAKMFFPYWKIDRMVLPIRKGCDAMSTVGQRIRLLREKRQWSQIQLAEKLGIHNTVLSRIESGEKKSVDDHLISKAADIFEVSTDFLHGKTDDPTPSWRKTDTAYRNERVSYFVLEGLTEDEIEEVKRHIDYVRWKAKQKRKRDR